MNVLHDLIDRLFRIWKNGLGYSPIQNARTISGTNVRHFARRQVLQLLVLGIGHRPEEHALIEPQQVRRRQHDARRGPGRPLCSP